MIFKNKFVRYVFFIILALGISVPLINMYFIFPAFTKLLIENTEKDAVRAALHLRSMYKGGYTGLTKDSISPDLITALKTIQNDFHFTKLKLFSEKGEIIYSTDPDDIETIEGNRYFHEIVAKGKLYSKIIKKETLSPEGDAVTAEVVHTYIPIMSGNAFVSAVEVNHDITRRSQALNNVVLKAVGAPFAMMTGGLVLTILILVQLDRSIARQKETEEKLKVFAEKLQRSNRELEDFAHVASHDLQEPLRKVMAFGDRLKSRYADALDERGRDYLERMHNASGRMQDLINGLLVFSRVTTRAQPFEHVDLTEIVREVVCDLEVSINETYGYIEIDDLVSIDADPLQMRQLLQNLIGNALKFSKEMTLPIVKVYGEKIHGNSADDDVGGKELYRLTVEDNGIGFDEKYAERIFGVFQRLHGRKEYEGAGIGLSICRKIIDRHKGKIETKSSPGEGASFIITLPVKQKNGGNIGHESEVNNNPDG